MLAYYGDLLSDKQKLPTRGCIPAVAAAAQVVANDEVMTEDVQKSSSLSVVKPIEQGILRQSVRQQTKSKQRALPSVQPLNRDRAKLLITIYA